MFCKNCGKKIADDAKFCSYCGTQQTKIDCEDYRSAQTTIEAPLAVSFPNKDVVESSSASSKNITPPIKKKHKKVMKWLIPLLVIFVIVVGIVIYSLKSENDKQNAFSIGVSSTDFTFTYDDSDGINVKTTVIPKYDFEDFTYTITYCGRGLLNNFEEDVVVGNVSAGTVLEHIKKLSEIENNISGAYSYTSIHCKSGKKQYKNKSDSSNVEYNTELDFVFTMKYYNGSDDYNLSCTITNKTSYYIKEVRILRISIDFGNDITCSFYTPRIFFEKTLAPNAQITLTNLSGNKSIGLGTADISGKKEMLKNGLDSMSYSKQTYQVIYT